MKIKRVLYLGYYIKKLDYRKFKKFLNYTHSITGKSKYRLLVDVVRSVFQYNISIIEYFQFRFFELDQNSRLNWAGSGYMYEYQLRMNPKKHRAVLSNKLLFSKEYEPFMKHFSYSIYQLEEDKSLFEKIIDKGIKKLVIKNSMGGGGNGIEILSTKDLSYNSLINKLKATSNDIVESFVMQHDVLMNLSSSGLNTIRIITQLTNENQVIIIGCRLRISINSHVDNLAAGNIVASIDPDSGIVYTNAVYSDMTKPPVKTHPTSMVRINGLKLPYWKQTIELVQRAALKNKLNRSIGWDVAITNIGPELIEGNHDWCKLVWQLPEQKGLKYMLDKYL